MKTFLANILFTALIAGTSAGKLDYDAPLNGRSKCALINVAMDESVSTANERAFLKDTALPRIGKTLRLAPYNYDEVFLCGGAFAGNNRQGTDQYRHKGCTTINREGKIMDMAVVTWKKHAGRYEDGWTGMVRSMEDVYDTIEGIELTSACGRIDKNMILVTDEDRDDRDSSLSENVTFDSVKDLIKKNGYILNVIANVKIDNNIKNFGMKMENGGLENTIFQQDVSESNGYKNVVENGDYKKFTGVGNRHGGRTITHYSDLVVDTPGALWNLNSLRAGGKIAETFADAFVSVKAEEMNNCPNGRCESDGSSNGDPHFKTWKQEHFEFHGQCDMLLARDAGFADGIGLDVQIRTKLVRFWSYIHTASIRIGGDILEIQGSPDKEDRESHYWFNFQYQADTSTVGGFPLSIKSNGAHKRFFEVDLSSKFPGQKIVLSAFREFVSVDFKGATPESFGKTVGLLGDFNSGKTLARDGATEMNDFNDLGNEWQVLPSDDMLFHDKSEPQFPERCRLPEDPQGERRRRLGESTVSVEQAEAACATLKDPLSIKDCVYDILATQDLDMVGAF
jgi:hypothetical protein